MYCRAGGRSTGKFRKIQQARNTTMWVGGLLQSSDSQTRAVRRLFMKKGNCYRNSSVGKPAGILVLQKLFFCAPSLNSREGSSLCRQLF